MKNYYPLALGHEWHYRQKDGSTYTNKVTAATGHEFTMHNSAANTSSIVRTDGNLMTTDALEAGNFQHWLTNDMQVGDHWVITFKANGLDCLLLMTVKETSMSKEVSGKVYTDVACVEAESQIIMNGSPMQLNFFTQYYYASDVGLILTTSSAGDIHELTVYKLH
jgi:hypothetical protein